MTPQGEQPGQGEQNEHDGSQNVQHGRRATMSAIAISRLYGGGGGEVAARLAQRLGWHLIDHEVVVRVARALGITQEEAEEHDEHVEGLITRMLASMALAYPDTTGLAPLPPHAASARYQAALRKVIVGAADEGNAVIVGRSGSIILADRPDVLRLLVVAPLESRIRYVSRREGLDAEAARRRIEQKDRDRTRAMQEHFQAAPTDPLHYDLVINTGILTLDDAVDLALLALERKGRLLGRPEEQLGAEAGVQPYPTRPGDIPSAK